MGLGPIAHRIRILDLGTMTVTFKGAVLTIQALFNKAPKCKSNMEFYREQFTQACHEALDKGLQIPKVACCDLGRDPQAVYGQFLEIERTPCFVTGNATLYLVVAEGYESLHPPGIQGWGKKLSISERARVMGFEWDSLKPYNLTKTQRLECIGNAVHAGVVYDVALPFVEMWLMYEKMYDDQVYGNIAKPLKLNFPGLSHQSGQQCAMEWGRGELGHDIDDDIFPSWYMEKHARETASHKSVWSSDDTLGLPCGDGTFRISKSDKLFMKSIKRATLYLLSTT